MLRAMKAMGLLHEELPGQLATVITVQDFEGVEDLKVPPDETKKGNILWFRKMPT